MDRDFAGLRRGLNPGENFARLKGADLRGAWVEGCSAGDVSRAARRLRIGLANGRLSGAELDLVDLDELRGGSGLVYNPEESCWRFRL